MRGRISLNCWLCARVRGRVILALTREIKRECGVQVVRSARRIELSAHALSGWEKPERLTLAQSPASTSTTRPYLHTISARARPRPRHPTCSPRIIIRRFPYFGLHLADVEDGILGLVVVGLDVVYRDLGCLFGEFWHGARGGRG